MEIPPSTSSGELVSTQFLAGFDGIPLTRRTMKSGYTLYAFAMPHNAHFRSAVVTSPNSYRIVGAALIHDSCGMLAKDGAAVDDRSRQLDFSQSFSNKRSASLFFILRLQGRVHRHFQEASRRLGHKEQCEATTGQAVPSEIGARRHGIVGGAVIAGGQ